MGTITKTAYQRRVAEVWAGSDVNDYIHIVPGIRGLACDDWVYTRENFALGPCHGDPKRQLKLRRAFWTVQEQLLREKSRHRRRLPKSLRSLEDQVLCYGFRSSRRTIRGFVDELATALARHPDKHRPCVLWTTTHWKDRLVFWNFLEAILRKEFDPARFAVATVRPRHASDFSKDWPSFYFNCAPEEFMRVAFDQRIPLSARLLMAGAGLWQKYASPSPQSFDAALRRGHRMVPDLEGNRRIYGMFFPEKRDGAYRVSRLDEIYLEGFQTDAWLSPLEVQCLSLCADFQIHKSKTRIVESLNANYPEKVELHRKLVKQRVARGMKDHFMLAMDIVGDLNFPLRLHAWSRHQPERPVLESQPSGNLTKPFNRIAYRLTERGRRILEEGLSLLDAAPPMFVGGCELYRPEKFWFREDKGNDWRIKFDRE